ncbi:phosphohydrolase [Rhodospirillum rubrum]|uniref:HD-GYP domain-containing protein n=1 Tax=Rhodospirillum rubrum TaxID=1085 RepID=UPI0019045CBC|nr:HD domain-containing phosphohydrolase [Rhodospirillum rubrum]MBK1663442.1 phosphohydrolase [Rhodospirillum rubrum]MBK1675375.1 phosphohydrolase [Rhodospirillum rubrum]
MSTALFHHHSTLQDQLVAIHAALRGSLPDIDRIAVAIYDTKTDALHTFIHSSDGLHPLDSYATTLTGVPSLATLASSGRIRVLNDLSPLALTGTHHSQMIAKAYRSSLTVPFYKGKALSGFLFFNSQQPDYFTSGHINTLALAAEMISSRVIDTVISVEMLTSTVQIAKDISHFRDEETGAHLDRVANYARLIAETMGKEPSALPPGRHPVLDDEFAQMIFLFAPLHDIGKVAIPDHVLLKPGPLTPEERTIMRTHSDKGLEICRRILENVDFISGAQATMLCDIVHAHHEAWDGSGYPRGLSGADIPLAATIVTVADVFDALTSARPYKKPWSTEDAFAYLQTKSGQLFNPACVCAFLTHRDEVLAIRARFRDEVTPQAFVRH